MRLDATAFDALTFDCYGTLIDWERGILVALGGLLAAHGRALDDERLLEDFGRHEAAIEAGPYRRYREVLAEVARVICAEQGISPSEPELSAFGTSVADWPPFADSARALAALASRYRLGVITNCDDDLFAASARKLGVTFAPVVTAEQVQAYKPDRRGFEAMLERIEVPRQRIVHVAQSLYHDHVPAKAMGLTTVWVDRRHGRSGAGATPPAEARPDLIVPDVETLARMLVGTPA